MLNIHSPSYYTTRFDEAGNVKYIEEHLIQRFHYLIEKTDSDIVISSSWRSDMEDLKSQMEKAGFKYWNRVIGRTPYSGHRGEEIQQYLKTHPEIKCYIVIDDEIDDICGKRCSAIPVTHVIETNMEIGISHKNISKAIDCLNNCEMRYL